MRRTTLVGAAMCALFTPASYGEESSRQAYEGAVAELWGFTATVLNTVTWCREKAPEIRLSLNDAENKWRERYGDLMADLERRMKEIIHTSDEFPPETRATALEELRQAADAMFRQKMADMPDEKARQTCIVFPAVIDGPEFTVEKRYPEKLALIRDYGSAEQSPK